MRDSCVNQLLSKIDGIQEFGNILVIGLTNRKDLIDPALLRSGRLEVHVEVEVIVVMVVAVVRSRSYCRSSRG